ncbi:MAG: cysteine hydrolase [archaeon]|nr:cysteine hydrolase [archaeon]
MRRALVVVDYQNDFVTGPLGGSDARGIESALHDRVSRALSSGEDVFFTMDTHDADSYSKSDEGRHIPVPHCIRGTPGWEIHGSLRPLSERCRIICKGTFGSPELASLISENGYDEVEVCGVATNVCVFANVVLIKTVVPECRVVVDPSLVASYDRAMGMEALRLMSAMCIDVKHRR